MKAGMFYRVKRTPFLRRYGVDVRGALSSHDSKAWPGEIGEVFEHRSTYADGTPRPVALVLQFSRHREAIAPRVPDDDDGYWKEKLADFEAQFSKCHQPKEKES